MGQKIKVLYILPLGSIGGAEKVVLSLCRYHNKEQFEVIVCVLLSRGVVSDEIVATGNEVIILNMANGFDFVRASRLISIIRKRKIDIVNIHGQTPLAKLFSVLSRCPVIIHTDHGTTIGSPVRRKRRVVIFNRLITPFIHKFIAISEGMKRSMMLRERVPKDKIVQIYNGINVAALSKPTGKREKLISDLNLSSGIPVLGTIGRLVNEKQLPLLVKVLSILDKERIEFTMLIIGDGPQRGLLDLLLQENNLSHRVKLLGYRNDIPELLELMDVFLFSSGGEAFSVVLLEVMAKALPIVAFDVEGVNEAVVPDKTGFLVPFGDVEAFAKKVRILLESPDLALRMGQSAFKRVNTKFNISNIIRKTESLYEELLHLRSGSSFGLKRRSTLA